MFGPHPLATYDETRRILPHTLIDVGDLLGAETFSLNGTAVVFRRRARPDVPGRTWAAELGDWLVSDADGWRVVADAAVGASRVTA